MHTAIKIKKSEALAWFGTSDALAKALGVSPSQVSWANKEYLPEKYAWRLWYKLNGRIEHEIDLEKLNGKRKVK